MDGTDLLEISGNHRRHPHVRTGLIDLVFQQSNFDLTPVRTVHNLLYYSPIIFLGGVEGVAIVLVADGAASVWWRA